MLALLLVALDHVADRSLRLVSWPMLGRSGEAGPHRGQAAAPRSPARVAVRAHELDRVPRALDRVLQHVRR